MSEKIFREKSLERVSSPEELNQYIKSTTPGLWFVLCAIIVFLIGVIAWAYVGRIDTGVDAGCIIKNGQYECYISEETYEMIEGEAFIKIDGTKSKVASKIDGPIQATNGDDYILHLSNIEKGDWYYVLKGQIDGVEDGQYKVLAVTESISPITFVFN